MKSDTRNKIIFGLSGLVGGLIAIIADVCQKAEASSFLKMIDVLGTRLGLPFVLPVISVVVLGIAALLPIIFDRKNKAESFYTGASVLAIMMTIMPYETPAGMTMAGQQQPRAVRESADSSRVLEKMSMPDMAKLDAVHSVVQGTVSVRLRAEGNRHIDDVLVSLTDASSGEMVSRTRFSGDRFKFAQQSGKYILSVEATGFSRYTRPIEIGIDGKDQAFEIGLSESAVPMALQRLVK